MGVDTAPGRRVGAAFIDLLLLTVVFLFFCSKWGKLETDNGSFAFELSGTPFLVFLLVFLGYYFVLEAATGRTLGKAILKLRVLNTDAERANLGQIALRNVVRIVDVLPVLYLVGFVSIACTKRHQRLGDLAARTLVVYRH